MHEHSAGQGQMAAVCYKRWHERLRWKAVESATFDFDCCHKEDPMTTAPNEFAELRIHRDAGNIYVRSYEDHGNDIARRRRVVRCAAGMNMQQNHARRDPSQDAK
jgi:hypothetical protein